jgi:hypothetical protein
MARRNLSGEPIGRKDKPEKPYRHHIHEHPILAVEGAAAAITIAGVTAYVVYRHRRQHSRVVAPAEPAEELTQEETPGQDLEA